MLYRTRIFASFSHTNKKWLQAGALLSMYLPHLKNTKLRNLHEDCSLLAPLINITISLKNPVSVGL